MVNYSEIVNLQRELFTQGIKVPLSEEDRAALGVNAETVYFKGTNVFVDGEKVKDPIYRKLFREYCFGFDPLILLGGETIPIDRARERIKSIAGRDVKFRIHTREGERPIIEFREPLPKHLKEEIERELEGFYRIEYSGCKKTKLAAFGIIGLIAGAASAGIYCGLTCGYKNSSNSMVKLEKNDKPLVWRNIGQQKLTKLAKDDVKHDKVKLSVAVEDGKSGKHYQKARYSNETLIKGKKSVSPDFKLNRTKKKMQKRDKERLNLEAKIMRDVKACPYSTSEYVKDVFDCSNMAKMLYDWLTERGHKCQVVYIENKTFNIKHNFIFVDGYAVEPMTKDWARWYYEKWFEIDKIKYLKPWQMRGSQFEYPPRW